MKSLLSSGLPKSRFVALLTLGLSGVVVGATPPPVFAGTGIVDQFDNVALSAEVEGFEAVMTSRFQTTTAAEGSLEANMLAYQQARQVLVLSVAKQDAAYADYQHVATMTRAEANDAYPSGEHGFVVAIALQRYNALQEEATFAQGVTQAALHSLSGGKALSHAAMAELHELLDL